MKYFKLEFNPHAEGTSWQIEEGAQSPCSEGWQTVVEERDLDVIVAFTKYIDRITDVLRDSGDLRAHTVEELQSLYYPFRAGWIAHRDKGDTAPSGYNILFQN